MCGNATWFGFGDGGAGYLGVPSTVGLVQQRGLWAASIPQLTCHVLARSEACGLDEGIDATNPADFQTTSKVNLINLTSGGGQF